LDNFKAQTADKIASKSFSVKRVHNDKFKWGWIESGMQWPSINKSILINQSVELSCSSISDKTQADKNYSNW